MSISVARYRLRFKHPFTTAHGTRDGTDAIFVRFEQDGLVGYGEAALPPYLDETADGVVAAIQGFRSPGVIDPAGIGTVVHRVERTLHHSPAAANALTMAILDLCAQQMDLPLWKFMASTDPNGCRTTVTLSVADMREVPERLAALPSSSILKVKLGTIDDLELLSLINRMDTRQLLLDANEALEDVDEVQKLLDQCGGRAIGIEQPFGRSEWGKHRTLQEGIALPVIADESVRSTDDLINANGIFGGVNIKLMKCGGLEAAKAMITTARLSSMTVMLGCMSESSLGCTAMAHLAGRADWVDLDGPLLIENDPFIGLDQSEAGVSLPERRSGIGATLKADLEFTHIIS